MASLRGLTVPFPSLGNSAAPLLHLGDITVPFRHVMASRPLRHVRGFTAPLRHVVTSLSSSVMCEASQSPFLSWATLLFPSPSWVYTTVPLPQLGDFTVHLPHLGDLTVPLSHVCDFTVPSIMFMSSPSPSSRVCEDFLSCM